MPGASTATPLGEMYRQTWLHAQGARGRLVAALGLQTASQMLKLALPWVAAQAINAIQTGAGAALRRAALFVGLHVLSWGLHGPARVLLSRLDRVAFMAGGRLADIGTPEELARRQPLFAAMWRGAAVAATDAGA